MISQLINLKIRSINSQDDTHVYIIFGMKNSPANNSRQNKIVPISNQRKHN